MPELESPTPRRPRDFRQPGAAPRWRIGVGAAVIAALVLLAVGVALSAFATARGASTPVAAPSSGRAAEPPRSNGSAATTAPAAGGVFVHILGGVAQPGLYEVGADTRAVDVVAAAGGFVAEADRSQLNLARRVSDGEQIVVPLIGESPNPEHAPAAGSPGAVADGSTTVDLNTADAATLQRLPGVGASTAEAILSWRSEHGRFASVDDLLDVAGIGVKKLDRIRESVRVG